MAKETREELVKRVMKVIHTSKDDTEIALAMTLLSVEDVRSFYEQLPMDSDCRCIICRGSLRSSTTIGKSEAIHLIELAYQCRKDRKKWIMFDTITNLTKEHWGTKSTKSTQLEHWGLIELASTRKRTNAIEVENVPQGSQRLTDYGYSFVVGRISVPETVYKDQYGNGIGFSKNLIYIYDVNTKSKDNKFNKVIVENHYKQRI